MHTKQNRTQKVIKIAILTQVRNSFDYIPAFIAYHLRLADTLFLIDHNSSVDLRAINQRNVNVYRVGVASFAKDLYMNYFIHSLRIKENYDFLFILDIDEFLPFKSRDDVVAFYDKHRYYPILLFNWRNGYNINSDEITGDRDHFIFTRWLSATRKLAYNLNQIRHFLPKEGNHDASYPFLDTVFISVRPREIKTNLGLFHIPVIGAASLRKKLQVTPTGKFGKRIIKNMTNLGLDLDRINKGFDPTDNDIMVLVANYRENNCSYHAEVLKNDFEHVDLFGHLTADIAVQKSILKRCPESKVVSIMNGEVERIKSLRRNRFLYIKRLTQAIQCEDDGQYRLK